MKSTRYRQLSIVWKCNRNEAKHAYNVHKIIEKHVKLGIEIHYAAEAANNLSQALSDSCGTWACVTKDPRKDYLDFIRSKK